MYLRFNYTFFRHPLTIKRSYYRNTDFQRVLREPIGLKMFYLFPSRRPVSSRCFHMRVASRTGKMFGGLFSFPFVQSRPATFFDFILIICTASTHIINYSPCHKTASSYFPERVLYKKILYHWPDLSNQHVSLYDLLNSLRIHVIFIIYVRLKTIKPPEHYSFNKHVGSSKLQGLLNNNVFIIFTIYAFIKKKKKNYIFKNIS